jgi:hypothetical protein
MSDRTETLYDYCDETGKLIYQVVRTNYPKDFRQRRPDDVDGWIYNIKGVTRLPYNLPSVLAAIKADTLIYLVEGEKDVDRLKHEGLTATTNNEGAGKWGDSQSQYFSGANVVILPDNDKVGRDHGTKAARSLCKAGAAQVRIVELPGLLEEGDVSNWLDQGHSITELAELVAGTPLWVSSEEPEPPKRQVNKARQLAPVDSQRLTRWALAALEGNIEEVTKSGPGEHFKALKAAAMRLGTIAAHGLLTDSECIDGVFDACQTNGYVARPGNGSPTEIRKRVESYFNKGKEQLCDLPQPRAAKTTQPKAYVAEQPRLSSNLHTVPDSLRAAMIEYAYPACGPVYELWNEAARLRLVNEGQTLTQAELRKLAITTGRNVSISTIKAGIKYGSDYFERVLPPIDLLTGEHDPLNNTGSKTQPKSTSAKKPAHRLAAQYRLLPLETICENIVKLAYKRIWEEVIPMTEAESTVAPLDESFQGSPHLAILKAKYATLVEGQPALKFKRNVVEKKVAQLRESLNNHHSTPLPDGWTYSERSEYKACFAHALITAAGGETQRRKRDLAAQLGVSERTVKAVLKRAAVEDIVQTKKMPINNISQVPVELTWFHKRLEAICPDQLSERQPICFYHLRDRQAAAHFIKSQITQGRSVFLIKQVANKQRVASLVQPEAHKREVSASLALVDLDDPQGKAAKKNKHKVTQKATPEVETSASKADKLLRVMKPTPQQYFGSDHEPNWLARAPVALLWLTKLHIDPSTGEMTDYSPEAALNILLGKPTTRLVEVSEPELLDDSPQAGLMCLDHQVENVQAEDPGLAVYHSWCSLADEARDDYFLSLTIEQQGYLRYREYEKAA